MSQSAARNSQTSAGVGNLPRSRIAGRQSPGNPQGLQHSGVLRVETGLRPGGYGPAGQPSPRGYGAARNSRSGGSIEGSSPHPVPFHEPGNIERRTSNEKEPSPHPDPLPSHQNGSGEGIASGRRGSVLNSGARLYEPQHIPMQSKPLRVADPRSENKSDTTAGEPCLTDWRLTAGSGVQCANCFGEFSPRWAGRGGWCGCRVAPAAEGRRRRMLTGHRRRPCSRSNPRLADGSRGGTDI